MKTVVIIFYCLVSAVAASFADAPAPFPIGRYQTLMSRSAFAPATEGAAGSPCADFAKDLVVTGVVRFNSGELVTISSRDHKQQFGLMRGQTRDGMSIAGVAWSDIPGRTRVTLKRGGEYAVIGFDEAAAQAGAVNVSPCASPGSPTAPGSVAPAAQPMVHPGNPPAVPGPNPSPRVIVP